MSSASAEGNKESEDETQSSAPAEDTSGLSAALASAEEENKNLLDQLIRMKAEFENFRKRADRDKPALIRHGRDEVLTRLLPLYDTLLSAHEQVVASAQEESEESSPEIVRGLELTFAEFTKFFEAEGIEVMDDRGKPYDVARHEVLGQVETGDFEDGTVMEILQHGYLIRGQTLRTAKVRIAKSESQGE